METIFKSDLIQKLTGRGIIFHQESINSFMIEFFYPKEVMDGNGRGGLISLFDPGPLVPFR